MARKLQLTQQQIAEMKAENPALAGFTEEQLGVIAEAMGKYVTTSGGGAIGFTLSPKGGLSLTGISAQYPVTFYESQWNRVLSEEVKLAYEAAVVEFGKDGHNCLSDKTDSAEEAARKEQVRRRLIPEKFAKQDAIAASGLDKQVKAVNKQARTIAQDVARSEGNATRPTA